MEKTDYHVRQIPAVSTEDGMVLVERPEGIAVMSPHIALALARQLEAAAVGVMMGGADVIAMGK